MLPLTDSENKTSILTRKKRCYPHLSVQNMAKKGHFRLIKDIFVAILKSALDLESPEFLKICYMMLLLTDSAYKTGILNTKKILSPF